MLAYRYKAIDKIGRPARGRLNAMNEVDLELRLRRMGLDLITFRRIKESASRLGRGQITRQDLITFCFDMEQITRAGIPILDGLRDLRESITNPRFREVVASLLEDMEGGKLLSQCLAAHPNVFSHVFIGLVRAGEQAGKLTEVFENLGQALKWQDELIAQTRRLTMYPALVFVVVLGAVIFLLTYMVPQVVSLLKNMGIALPLQTKILIAISDFVVAAWPFLLVLPVVAFAAGNFIIRTNPKARYMWDYMKLRLPVTGPILQKIIIARFANFFALMYQSGITILDALRTSEEVVANRVIADGLARASQQVGAGASLTETFTNLGMFPPLVLRMLRTGESTGALDTALLNISYFYNRDVKESIERALKLLEPMLTLILGVILALIMFSVLTPVYDILGKIKF
ncbi:MAG: type II secretion system F family protein [Burkholderiales bacterium]